MAHGIYRDQLAITHAFFGHGLWNPAPEERYGTMKAGDVGYMRLFNALPHASCIRDYSTSKLVCDQTVSGTNNLQYPCASADAQFCSCTALRQTVTVLVRMGVLIGQTAVMV